MTKEAGSKRHGQEHLTLRQRIMTVKADDEAVRKAFEYDQRPFIQNLAQGAGLALSSKIGLESRWDVLDFACGTGLVLQRIANEFGSAVGIDSSPGMIHVLSEKKLKGVTPCCVELSSSNTLQQYYAEHNLNGNVPHQFDLIYTSMALHHLQDIPATVQQLRDYLKPGGTLVGFDFEKGPESMLFHPQPISPTVHHPGGFAPADLIGFWQHAGLKQVSCERVHRFTKEVTENDQSKKVVFWMLMVTGSI